LFLDDDLAAVNSIGQWLTAYAEAMTNDMDGLLLFSIKKTHSAQLMMS
jgi:hypothetical protein